MIKSIKKKYTKGKKKKSDNKLYINFINNLRLEKKDIGKILFIIFKTYEAIKLRLYTKKFNIDIGMNNQNLLEFLGEILEILHKTSLNKNLEDIGSLEWFKTNLFSKQEFEDNKKAKINNAKFKKKAIYLHSILDRNIHKKIFKKKKDFKKFK